LSTTIQFSTSVKFAVSAAEQKPDHAGLAYSSLASTHSGTLRPDSLGEDYGLEEPANHTVEFSYYNIDLVLVLGTPSD